MGPNACFESNGDCSEDDEQTDISITVKAAPVLTDSYPVHWDFVKSNNQPQPLVPAIPLPLTSIIHRLQSEYWWCRNKASSVCHKNTWIENSHSEDNRNELTEYQLVREVIWLLMGACSTYAFRVQSDQRILTRIRVIPANRVSISSLSYPALDSLLQQFARFARHELIVRTFIHYVICNVSELHPCIIAFAMCLEDMLAEFDHQLHEIQTEARGPKSFTLTALHLRLLVWRRRMGLLAGILMRFTTGDLNSLSQESSHALLLNMLHYINTTFTDCSGDASFLHSLLLTFLRTFHPYASSIVRMLSGKSEMLEFTLGWLLPTSLEATEPDFWQIDLDRPAIHLPRILEPVFPELLECWKIFSIIDALSNDIGYPRSENLIVDDPDRVLHQLIGITPSLQVNNKSSLPLSTSFSTRRSHRPAFVDSDFLAVRKDLLDTIYNYEGIAPTETKSGLWSSARLGETVTVEKLQANVHQFVRERCALLNHHLIQQLLSSNSTQTIVRNLGSSLAAIGAVYLFGAGDRMNDFTRGLFEQIGTLNDAWYYDMLGLTLRLRAQFECERTVPQFLRSERDAFSFVRAIESAEKANRDGLTFCSLLQLTYHADWPSKMLLSDTSMKTYNGVFCFLTKVKYTRWSLEQLRFAQLTWLQLNDPSTHHCMILLRMDMLHLFTGLHDFLSHRVEAMRTEFTQRWCLPSLTESHRPTDQQPMGTMAELFTTHQALLSGLESICLLTDSTEMLRIELDNLSCMVLTFCSLWSHASPRSVGLGSQVPHLAHQFTSHVSCLARLLGRFMRLSNMDRLYALAETFFTAASFTIVR